MWVRLTFLQTEFASLSSPGAPLADTAGAARPSLLDPNCCKSVTSNRLPEWKIRPRTTAETGLHRAQVAGPGRIVKNLIQDAIRRDVRLSVRPTMD